jgi:hypothetical protein
MGNWFDDSLQVAAPLRRLQFRNAFGEALAWSKALRVPVASILWRAARAVLPAQLGCPRVFSQGYQLGVISTETSLAPEFLERTGATHVDDLFSNDWMEAPPERRAHFRLLSFMREHCLLQRPESLRGCEFTHPFTHRPLVELLMRLPARVLCTPGAPRRLMRRAFAEWWPEGLRTRRSKSLFAGPWIEALRPMAMRLLAAPRLEVVERGWIERTSLMTRLQKLTQGLDCNEPQLRQVILLEYWLRNRTRHAQVTPVEALQAS